MSRRDDNFNDDDGSFGERPRKGRFNPPPFPQAIKDILRHVEWTLTDDSITFNTKGDVLQTAQLDNAKEWLLKNAPEFSTKGVNHLKIPIKTMDEYIDGWREIIGMQELQSARKSLINDAVMRSLTSEERPATFWTAERVPSELPTAPQELSFLECASKKDAVHVEGLLKTAGIKVVKERRADPDRNHKTAVNPIIFVHTRDLQKAGITPHSPSYSELDHAISLDIIRQETWERTNSFATTAAAILPKSEAELLKEALHVIGCNFQEISPSGQNNSIIIAKTLDLKMKVPDISIIQLSATTAIIPRPNDEKRGR